MNSLRQKIEEILQRESYSLRQLADYLNLSEAQLIEGIENKTLELRYLEEISKNLKVPLYSFFRDKDMSINFNEKPYYTNKLWQEESDNSDKKLLEEIELLKQALAQKEQLLKNKKQA